MYSNVQSYDRDSDIFLRHPTAHSYHWLTMSGLLVMNGVMTEVVFSAYSGQQVLTQSNSFSAAFS